MTDTNLPDPTSSICLRQDPEEIIRIDKEGFHYRGQFIADAGEAHRLMLDFLRKNTQPKSTLTVQDCNDMRKHAGNYIAEDSGEITLNFEVGQTYYGSLACSHGGYLTREDLIEIANTVPPTEA